jgi:hypothetical protein
MNVRGQLHVTATLSPAKANCTNFATEVRLDAVEERENSLFPLGIYPRLCGRPVLHLVTVLIKPR